VTSNLALNQEKAEDGRGRHGTENTRVEARKLFVVNTLTSKSPRFKILQGIFLNPAPEFLPERSPLKRARRALPFKTFFGKFPQAQTSPLPGANLVLNWSLG
jgi:hypothetical protein